MTAPQFADYEARPKLLLHGPFNKHIIHLLPQMPENTFNIPTIASLDRSLRLLVTALVLFVLVSPAFCFAKTVLKVGVYENKPLIFTAEDGRVSGLFPDILEKIANEQGWEISYQPAPWNQLLDQLRQEKIDLLPAIAFSSERAEWLSFSDETILVNWAEVYSSTKKQISSLLDLQGQRVAVKENDIHFQALRMMAKKFDINCRFIEADEYQTIFEMLDAGYLDIGVVNRFYGEANKKNFQVKVTPIIFNPIELRFAAPKGTYQDILSQIDNRLRTYKQDSGSIYHLAMQRWLASEQAGSFPAYLPYLLGGLIAAFLVLVALNLLLKHQVARQTSTLTTTNRHLKEEIHKRQKTMQELKKYARVVEASNDAVALFDRDNNHLLVNSAYLNTFRVERNELQEKTLPEVIGLAFYEQHLMRTINRCLSGEQVAITTSYARPGQPLKHLNIHLGPYMVSDNYILGYAMDIRDITQQVELENQLKQAQKMEAIGMLAGGVAHDLNNILSGLVSYPDMLLVNRSQDDPMYRPLQIIRSSGERAAAIVSDLLTLARRGVENFQPVSLNTIIREFATSPEYKNLLKSAHGIDVKLTLDEELLSILATPVSLAKCVMNLFTNGLEAMPGGGLLTIATANRYLEQHELPHPNMVAGEYVILSVADTGLGMDQDKISHIFEPFYTSKVMGRSGTGLGMTLVWNAIKDHKGHIAVDSTPGVGTTFTLYFPATRERAAATIQQDLSRFQGHGESILVIDDIQEQRRFASEMLTMLGYLVDTAASGEEAIGMIQRKPYDIIVLDMIMPGGMDGLTTYQKILTLSPDQKAVIASGFSEAENVTKVQAIGAGPLVQKPYTVLSLASAIKKELSKSVSIKS
ncbi:ATP-binding protein [Desulfopila aestuarii]|uniref:histidine kinase n=1 Tax=Desulfopila aestuarii DSM 18488 TaxID=1121416 RepID=A0A1M7Y6R5_9BACT|nr:transporter substrate-binding domain-containing protein [Desulfopila aestuarii]SHO48319.1 PAS domain S-box-containing protein [Desulfopila aestuarii DSM 18488]